VKLTKRGIFIVFHIVSYNISQWRAFYREFAAKRQEFAQRANNSNSLCATGARLDSLKFNFAEDKYVSS